MSIPTAFPSFSFLFWCLNWYFAFWRRDESRLYNLFCSHLETCHGASLRSFLFTDAPWRVSTILLFRFLPLLYIYYILIYILLIFKLLCDFYRFFQVQDIPLGHCTSICKRPTWSLIPAFSHALFPYFIGTYVDTNRFSFIFFPVLMS